MKIDENRFEDVTHALIGTFEFMKRCGLTGLECSEKTLKILESWNSGAWVVKTISLEDIRADLGNCQRCKLGKKRTHLVFGEGNPNARLVFVGEGPGFDEDQKGKPFVGAAGKLLAKIIAAMGLKREDVYICNVIKCRPPKNRNPEPDEIKACLPFLKRQLAAIGPEYICTLGSVATRALLQTDEAISRLRGKFFQLKKIKVMPTYHPAFLLYNPDRKREVWEDIQKLMKALARRG